MGNETLDERLRRYAAAVAGELRAVTATRHGLGAFYGMVHYHMGWVDQYFAPREASAGKGLRSAFCLLCCEVCEGDWRDALALAAGIDLLHNFSLVHDDIEDDSHTRRHRRTVWSLWGAAQGINLGDAMFALAELAPFHSPLATADPARLLEIQRATQETILSLAEGQYLDMSFETRDSVSLADYLAMIERKSALLIAHSAWTGAMAAGAPRERCAALHAFGRALGLAFQVRDDLLGIWGDEEVTGKSRASDLLSRKKTLPVVLALEEAPPGAEEAREALRAVYAGREPLDAAGVDGVLELLGTLRARERAEEALAVRRTAAAAALDRADLPDDARDMLLAFSTLLIDRAS